MPSLAFSPRPLQAATQLPLTLISLEDWALVTVTGADSISYLQGQVTLDVAALAADQHRPAAHCDAKGKMWSNLRLFHRHEGLACIERRSLHDTQLSELKKYAVFSKVTMNADDDAVLLGLAGSGARSALAALFSTLPDAHTPVVQQDDTTLLWFELPAERFLLVTSQPRAAELQQQLSQAQLNNSSQWLALDIAAGFAVIDTATSGQLIPQATNLQALDGISFKKGCYSGQEMVARAKFRGANKRALFWLAGKATQLPAVGDSLEMQLGENWRRTGLVLASCQLESGEVWVQAVLNNDLETDTLLRVQGDSDGQLTIQPLPYPITEG